MRKKGVRGRKTKGKGGGQCPSRIVPLSPLVFIPRSVETMRRKVCYCAIGDSQSEPNNPKALTCFLRIVTLIVSIHEISFFSSHCLQGCEAEPQEREETIRSRALPGLPSLKVPPRAPLPYLSSLRFRQIRLDCFDRLHLYRSQSRCAVRGLCSRCAVFQ